MKFQFESDEDQEGQIDPSNASQKPPCTIHTRCICPTMNQHINKRTVLVIFALAAYYEAYMYLWAFVHVRRVSQGMIGEGMIL